MGIILGIDVGGSTTKIVGMRPNRELISTMMVKAYDQLTSLYGALGNYMDTNGLPLSDVEKIYITGVGSSYLSGSIYGIPTIKVEEFSAIGKGGLWLSGLEQAIVVSMGTGTAFVKAKGNEFMHIGGSGVGGGTLVGLGCRLTSADGFDSLCRLAEKGNLKNVDLTIGAITKQSISTLHSDITAANFANLNSDSTEADIALGLVNMVLQTVFTLGVFAARGTDTPDGPIVLTGSLTGLHQIDDTREAFSALYPNEFILPPHAAFATAIGAALHGC
ncbi:MAG: pantothenate kinase [Clostridiales bacterium]|nr:pantothenate kinase [Clostridiales bacterium]